MLRYLENVVSLRLNADVCNGCGMCVEVCPQRVLAIEGRKAHVIDRDACIECGACATNCPAEALSVKTGAGCATGLIMEALGKEGDCCGGGCSCSATEGTKAPD
jgi:ferredoxin